MGYFLLVRFFGFLRSMAAGMEPRGVRGPGRGHADSPDAPGGQAAPRDAAAADAAAGLVERFDIEPFPDFSAK